MQSLPSCFLRVGLQGAVLLLASAAIATGQHRGSATPAVVLNEIVVNPNGGDDNCEYAELRGPGDLGLSNVYFVSIEGDAPSNEGTFDFLSDLHSESLGPNGLLVITAMDTTGVCGLRDWGSSQGTTLVRDADLDNGRFENATNSWLLIYSPTTALVEGVDYDTDDDGTLEGLPGDAVILDGLGWTDGGGGDIVYSSVNLPATAGGTPDMASRFLDATRPSNQTNWYYGDMDGASNSTMYDPTQVSPNFPMDGELTPGLPNQGILYLFEDDFEAGDTSAWSSSAP